MDFYSDNDPRSAAWLRELIAEGLIPEGTVDERSIADIRPDDLAGYRQCHFFAGVGGWPLALQLAGWPADRPVFTGSCPCFPAGVLVMTQQGYKPIECVEVGDLVLTHKGRFRPVQHIGSGIADCVQVKGQGHFGLVCTPNHPFLVEDGRWIEAANLKGHRWANVAEVPPVPTPDLVPLKSGCFFDKNAKKFRAKGELNGKPVYLGLFDTFEKAAVARRRAVMSGRVAVRGADAVDIHSPGFARLLGYWIGDGWVSRDSVFLCGSRGDLDLLNSLFADARLPGSAYLERTSSRIRCGSKHLAAWLRTNFGQYADGKRIPAWLHGMPADYRLAFLDGYAQADGHTETQSKGGGRVQVFTTASRALAIGVRVLLNQAGLSASIRVIQNNRDAIIESRLVSELPSYRVTAYETARSFRFSGQHGWGLVRSVEPAGLRTVYNLAVEEDESYTADGIVVHNCQPFSAAGKRKGEADDRHLWPVFFRLIRECRPDTVVGEQVASAIGHGWLDGVFADLEAEGYACGALVLGAHSVGAPHKRQRLFWVASRIPVSQCWGQQKPEVSIRQSRQEQAAANAGRSIGRLPHSQEHGRRQGRAEPSGSGERAGTQGTGERPADDCGGGAGGVHDAKEHGDRALDGESGPGDGQQIASGGSGYGVGGLCDSKARGLTRIESREEKQRQHNGESGTTDGGDVFNVACGPGATGFWSHSIPILYRDGKYRRVPAQPGIQRLVDGLLGGVVQGGPACDAELFPLAPKGIVGRVGLLRGYGNAICPQVAALFIRAFLQAEEA